MIIIVLAKYILNLNLSFLIKSGIKFSTSFISFLFLKFRISFWVKAKYSIINPIAVEIIAEYITVEIWFFKLYEHFKIDRNVRSEELTHQEIEKIYQFLKGEGDV